MASRKRDSENVKKRKISDDGMSCDGERKNVAICFFCSKGEFAVGTRGRPYSTYARNWQFYGPPLVRKRTLSLVPSP